MRRTPVIVAISQQVPCYDNLVTGAIDIKQLKCAMRALGFEPKKEEVKRLSAELDRDKSGKVAYEDFESLMAKKIDEKGTRDEILRAFQLFDEDNTGKISFENLKKV